MYAETTTVRDQIDSLYFDKLISLECSWQGTWCDCLSSTTSRASRLAYAGCLRRPWACKTVAITYSYVDITSAALFQCAISGAKRKAAQATTGRGIESTHNTRHFTYTRTLPKQKTRKKRKNNKPFVLPCLKFSHSLSLSLSLLQLISSHLYIITVKKLAKKPRPPLVLCKKTNGIKCWLHQFIFNFALHTLYLLQQFL